MTATNFIRLPRVQACVGLKSPEAVWCRLRPSHPQFDPDFPKPIKIGKRAVAWVESEVQAYQQALIAKRDQAEG